MQTRARDDLSVSLPGLEREEERKGDGRGVTEWDEGRRVEKEEAGWCHGRGCSAEEGRGRSPITLTFGATEQRSFPVAPINPYLIASC